MWHSPEPRRRTSPIICSISMPPTRAPVSTGGGLERKGLGSRDKADALVAPAFIHLMAIGRHIPLNDDIDWLIGVEPSGVIELGEMDDPTVRQMLQFC